jgi:hypothetical protein
MKLNFTENTNYEVFEKSITQFDSDSEIDSILIFISDKNNIPAEKLNELLLSMKKKVWGGVFPQLIYNKQNYEEAFLLVGCEEKTDVHIVKNLSSPETDFDEILDHKIESSEDFNTLFVFVDGFAKRISALIDGLFNTFGLEKNVIGGGAGSLSMEQQPCIISNEGLLMDAAIFAFLKSHSGIGVSHGWEKLSGPYRVTESDRNEIISLDWEPAFTVYKKMVELDGKLKFENDNFFDVAKCYPFGIKKIDAEDIVRDPISNNETGSLICVGEVPVNSYVDLLTGDLNSLIKSAEIAYKRAMINFNGDHEPRAVFVIDCISRVLFLNEKIKDELAKASNYDLPQFGVLSLGEVANNNKDYLEFYNKTIVVGII